MLAQSCASFVFEVVTHGFVVATPLRSPSYASASNIQQQLNPQPPPLQQQQQPKQQQQPPPQQQRHQRRHHLNRQRPKIMEKV